MTTTDRSRESQELVAWLEAGRYRELFARARAEAAKNGDREAALDLLVAGLVPGRAPGWCERRRRRRIRRAAEKATVAVRPAPTSPGKKVRTTGEIVAEVFLTATTFLVLLPLFASLVPEQGLRVGLAAFVGFVAWAAVYRH